MCTHPKAKEISALLNVAQGYAVSMLGWQAVFLHTQNHNRLEKSWMDKRRLGEQLSQIYRKINFLPTGVDTGPLEEKFAALDNLWEGRTADIARENIKGVECAVEGTCNQCTACNEGIKAKFLQWRYERFGR